MKDNVGTEKDLINIFRPEFRKRFSSIDQSKKSRAVGDPKCMCGCPLLPEVEKVAGELPWQRRHAEVFPTLREPQGSTETRQQKAMRRLRSRLSVYKGHHVYGPCVQTMDKELLLWLEAYDYNVFLTEAKLKKHLELRRHEDMEQIVDNYSPPIALQLHYAGGLCGQALDECLVLYELVGSLQMGCLVTSASRQEIRRFILHRWEHIRHKLLKSNAPQVLLIVDMAGFNLRSLVGSVLMVWREIIEIFQENYVWMVREIIVIKSSPICQELYFFLRPYISRLVVSKITNLGYNHLKYLLKRIARHELPAFLGGYKCDMNNNPFCKEDLNWDVAVPRWMNITNPFQTAQVENLTILGGQRLVKDYVVTAQQTTMVWQFLTLSHSLEVSLYLDDITDEKCLQNRTVINGDNYNRPKGLICRKAGRYIFIFDNWRHLATKFSGIMKLLIQPARHLTLKYATRKSLGQEFNMSKPIGPEERILRRSKNIK